MKLVNRKKNLAAAEKPKEEDYGFRNPNSFDGSYIAGIETGSPADVLGRKVGDIILSAGRHTYRYNIHFEDYPLKNYYKPGDIVTAKILRDELTGNTYKIRATKELKV